MRGPSDRIYDLGGAKLNTRSFFHRGFHKSYLFRSRKNSQLRGLSHSARFAQKLQLSNNDESRSNVQTGEDLWDKF